MVIHTHKKNQPLSAILGIQLQADAHCKSFSDITMYLLFSLTSFTLPNSGKGPACSVSWYCCPCSELGMFWPGQFKLQLFPMHEHSRTVRGSINERTYSASTAGWMWGGSVKEHILPAQYQGDRVPQYIPWRKWLHFLSCVCEQSCAFWFTIKTIIWKSVHSFKLNSEECVYLILLSIAKTYDSGNYGFWCLPGPWYPYVF